MKRFLINCSFSHWAEDDELADIVKHFALMIKLNTEDDKALFEPVIKDALEKLNFRDVHDLTFTAQPIF